MGTPIVRACHRPVSLLSSSIPNLSLYCFIVDGDYFGCELYANGRFGFEVELVFGEFRNDVGLAYS